MPWQMHFRCNADDAVTLGDVKQVLENRPGRIRENSYILTGHGCESSSADTLLKDIKSASPSSTL